MQAMDAIIAATASVHELSVVTMNAKHYRHVPGIRVVTVRGA
jgi:predicted nucleic acid-binding protein